MRNLRCLLPDGYIVVTYRLPHGCGGMYDHEAMVWGPEGRVGFWLGEADPMRESRIARSRGLAMAIAECRDDARLDGIREGAAEIVQLLEAA